MGKEGGGGALCVRARVRVCVDYCSDIINHTHSSALSQIPHFCCD